MSIEIDRERAEKVLKKFSEAVAENLKGESSPARIYEVLNALAAQTAEVFVGTGCDPKAQLFFNQAVHDCVADLQKRVAIAAAGGLQ